MEMMQMSDVTTSGLPDFGWLLEDFVRRVPGVDAALLASSDGLPLAVAGLTGEEAEKTAAVMSGLHSLAKSVGMIKGPSGGGVRQVVVELDRMHLFVTSAGDGLPAGVPVRPGIGVSAVGTVVGVLAAPDADLGAIGYETATLIKSVSEHLVTATRRGEAHDGQ
jgi:predicted regulator of Ras-like GTPase activity (Roadblock/LC7/MglB family)